jgi:uncharacterized protein (DUF58 family)
MMAKIPARQAAGTSRNSRLTWSSEPASPQGQPSKKRHRTLRLDPLQRARPGSAERVLRRLEWTVIRRLDGLLQGDYRTLLRGAGIDLADLREYQHHDDVRHIDWNVTARLQQPYVRQFTEDRDLSGLVPARPVGQRSISAPTEVTKLAVAAGFVAVRWRALLTRHGNRVGALLYGSGRRHRAAAARGAPATCCNCCSACAAAAARAARRRHPLADLLKWAAEGIVPAALAGLRRQ